MGQSSSSSSTVQTTQCSQPHQLPRYLIDKVSLCYDSLHVHTEIEEATEVMSYSIPNHLFANILVYLEISSIPTLFLVSKNWYESLDSDIVWQELAAHIQNRRMINSEYSIEKFQSHTLEVSQIRTWKDLVVYPVLLQKYSFVCNKSFKSVMIPRVQYNFDISLF
jgi:hypothetical protein